MADFVADLTTNPLATYTFLHFVDPDKAGHANGWTRSVPPANMTAWETSVKTCDTALGSLFNWLNTHPVEKATTAIIVSATRRALASNREIVEVLHFVGATDRFIAREFEKHFLRLGIRAGIVGAAAAMAVFIGLPFVMEMLGGGTVTMAEIHRLVGSGSLDFAGYILLGIVVVVIAALCMLTSRLGVYRILHTRH